MDIEKLIEQLNDWNEKYISNLCGDRTIKCEEYCIKDDCLIVKAATALSMLQAENEKLRAELEQVKAERDAAVEKIREWEKFDTYLLIHNFITPEKWCGQKEDGHGTALQNDTLCV